ncbi:MAG: alanyl-tRNA synthetase [Actinomycetota bacterium]|nr:alanyl-tRNA synthetase [Actinomycetota bacterium]
METAEIKRRWLEYFGKRDHAVVPSASLLLDDPNLLFVNAGMVPFKPYFLGQETPPWKRATSVQKCVRTLDIEEVGRTTRHGTFFQMNGNFSFGDYFKEGAIELAWELVTRPQNQGGFGFPESKLLASVYEEDDEAFRLWRKISGLPEDRIVRLGKKENFWSMGVPGPCGPCSEILIDRGPEYGPEGDIEGAGDRYLEFWNLVFMQYERGEGTGKADFPILGELPNKSIDTGMGLERVAFLLQGVDNLYEIDEVFPVLDRAADLAGKRYGAGDSRNAVDDIRLRVVADHVRSALMLINDGVTPSNEARGYVLRRLLRRTVRSMRLLGVDEPVLPELLPVSRDAMAPSYPEVATGFERIAAVAYAEEEAFRQTLRSGTTILDTAVRDTKAQGGTSLSGERAFQLHDTYGFPIDLTLEMAAEQGLSVDEAGFRSLMSEQRERAQADARTRKTGHADLSAYRDMLGGGSTTFTGYDEVVTEARVLGLLVDGVAAPAARQGDEVELVLDRTPFYAEGGGQLADQGRIRLGNGAEVQVRDVQSPLTGVIVHRGRVVSGEVARGDTAVGEVDVARRRAISRAHTATHLVHKAFRQTLGETATQAGSENAPGRFRFDFASPTAVPASVLTDVEQEVNEVLAADLAVQAEVMTQEQARAAGAMALFGEKYGDQVRVVSVGDWARELCGGTHAQRSGQLGLVKILGEASIGAGVRRVEALVGTDAYQFLAREHALVSQLSDMLKVTRSDELPDRVAALTTRLRDVEKDLERVRSAQVLQAAGDLAANPTDVFGVGVVTHRLPDGTGADDLRRLVLDVRGRIPADRPAVVAAVAVSGDRPAIVVAVNDKGREWGVKAGELVRAAAQVLGGGGGGKDDVAQGGGSDRTRIDEALRQVEHVVGQRVTGSV